jgi:hypothetical protein
MEISKARGLSGNDPLALDLLMVSHIDDDHIKGILEMTNELVIASDSGRPLPLKIRSFWHNTFDDIIGNKPDELLAAVTASFGAAPLGGESDSEGLDPDVAKVLASVGQGFRLRDDVRKLKLHINPVFGGRLIMATRDGKSIDMGKGLRLTVALQMLLDARGSQSFSIHLTYPVHEIDIKREEDWNKEQKKERDRQQKNPEAVVREDWSPAKHSLTTFFADHEDFGRKVSVVEGGKPHLIELLDEVGL